MAEKGEGVAGEVQRGYLLNLRVSPKRVGRLMRRAGIAGASRRRSTKTTTRDQRAARPAPDLVDRDFSAAGADQLWVADITYVRTWSRFLYVAVVLDAWSRRVVGWSMAAHLRTKLVLDALNMAIWRRRSRGVVTTATRDRSTRRSRSGHGARRLACDRRLARWAMRTTTRCPRASS